MGEPSPARPIPGPPSPGPSNRPAIPVAAEAASAAAERDGAPFEGLTELPVAEHVAVFEAEHDRLQRELSTIDRL
jgi:hypothetical protein